MDSISVLRMCILTALEYWDIEVLRGSFLTSLGNVPDEVVDLCEGCDLRASHIWASIQAVLKRNGLRRYYNRIGQIIWKMVRLKIDFAVSAAY